MMRRRIVFLGLLAFAALPMLGCGGGSSNNDGGRDIGPAGGTVFDSQARAGLTIPAGALTTTMHFTITRATTFPTTVPGTTTSFPIVPGTTFVVTPAVNFAVPATMSITYDPAQIPAGKTEANLAVCMATATTWLPVNGTTIDTTNKKGNSNPSNTNNSMAFGILAVL